MSQDEQKRAVAQAALDFVEPGMILGIGTGSTVNHFIDALAKVKSKIDGTVASSEATAQRLRQHSIQVLDLNGVDELALYVDGADEADRHLQLIKGGGGALTREKIVASVAKKFICIVDQSKLVGALGNFPVAVEVLPMARSYAARVIMRMGGNPLWREHYVTDNGNPILDVYNLDLNHAAEMEDQLDLVTGVVANGIFARRKADLLLVARADGVETLTHEA